MPSTDDLSALDTHLAAVLARRITLLAEPGAPPIDDQLDASAPEPALPAGLWRAVLTHPTAAAHARRTPPSTPEPRRITIVGGNGAMARLLAATLGRHRHAVTPLDADDWSRAPTLLGDADLALIAVPIHETERAIRNAAPHLRPDALLADITSIKAAPVRAMLDAHRGPVLGLHPMFGPHVSSLLAQRIIACPARHPDAAAWLLDAFRADGATIIQSVPDEHDRMMVAVQAIRHFTTFALGVFLADHAVDVPRSLEFASPIYRLEIDIVSRLFAQSPDLYLSIMSATGERTAAITDLAHTVSTLARALAEADHDALRDAFTRTARRLGPEAPRALAETTLAVEALSAALAARTP